MTEYLLLFFHAIQLYDFSASVKQPQQWQKSVTLCSRFGLHQNNGWIYCDVEKELVSEIQEALLVKRCNLSFIHSQVWSKALFLFQILGLGTQWTVWLNQVPVGGLKHCTEYFLLIMNDVFHWNLVCIVVNVFLVKISDCCNNSGATNTHTRLCQMVMMPNKAIKK